MENRRAHTRYRIWLPVRLDTDTVEDGMAVSHDTSQKGIQLATASPLDVGAQVTVTFRVPPESGAERTLSAKVIRVEPNVDDPYGLWPNRVAVEFDEAQEDLEELLHEIERRSGSF